MGKNDYINLDSTKQTIPAGSHTCLLYEDEAKKNEFILQFISTGIQKGEKVLCITDSLTREEILDSVGQDDYISGHVPHSGLIVTNTKNMYYPDGYFSPEEMLQRWRRLAEEAVDEGFSMLRATGETNWLANGLPGAEKFVEYEVMINGFIKGYPVTIICQFDTRCLHGGVLMEIINVHPLLIVNGQIMHNPFYFSPDTNRVGFNRIKTRAKRREQTNQISTLLLAVTGILEILPTLRRKAEFTEGILRTVLNIKKYHLCLKRYAGQSFTGLDCRGCQAPAKGDSYDYYSCSLTGRPDLVGYEIKTVNFFFGYLLLSRREANNDLPLTALVFNYLNLLALSLENSLQKEQLQALNRDLQAEITGKEKIAALLRQNEQRIKAIMKGTDEGLWEWDLSGGTIEYDENWQRILGYEPGEIRYDYEWFKRNVHPDHRLALDKALKDYREGGQKYYELEYKIKTKSGRWKWVWTRGITLPNGENTQPFKLTGTNRDITLYRDTQKALQTSEEQLAAEKERSQLLKMQKLESLGILAGGIAHDFNNLLSAILSRVQLVVLKLGKESDAIKDLQAVEKATLKAAKLTKQLLAFSKGGAPVKQAAMLSEIIKETAEFALKGTPVKIEYFLSPELWTVEIDGGQISQVIHNLVINAHHAMPEGGVIKISARNEVVSSKNEMMLKIGKYVKVDIEDEGTGIPEETLTKIFDPYFTTKKSGNGLGLSSSYYIIKNHNGYIGVRSKVGIGSTFYFYLPASQQKLVPVKKSTNLSPDGNGRRILLMDDEPLIRNSVQEFLENCGYKVSTAEEGLAAVALYKQGIKMSTPFDVVIMDLTVPGGMGGKEAVKQILAIDPKAKVIVSSGYSNDPVMSDYQKYGFCNVVTKPFKMEELSEKITNAVPRDVDKTTAVEFRPVRNRAVCNRK